MAGIQARAGFEFQDSILAERVLEHYARVRQAEVNGDPPPTSPRFGVEAAPDANIATNWDLLEISAPTGQCDVLLEEVKGGEVAAKDRRSLWRRVRRSFRSNWRMTVRLTVDRDNLPSLVPHWQKLAETAATESLPGKRPKRVDSVETLAHEALYFLTSARADESDAVPEHNAREILGRFEFDDTRSRTDVRTATCRLLSLLQFEVGEEATRITLAGSIGERAASRHDDDHLFTADEILQHAKTLQQLSTVNPDEARLWRDLHANTARWDAVDAATSEGVGLPYHDWRSLQPAAAAALDAPGMGAVAVIGRGGLGKSVAMERYCRERASMGDKIVWIEGRQLTPDCVARLDAALDLGAFCASLDGQSLLICVDSLEGAADTGAHLAALIAALGRSAASPSSRVVVTCRRYTWSSLFESTSPSGWRSVVLEEWPVPLVNGIAGAGRQRPIGADLLKLLRTPLLLDLFARTFPAGADIPPGLQTRHGILRAHWRRRILQTPDSAARRRALLLATADEEAMGHHYHCIDDNEAGPLASEGLFRTGGGRYAFRHPLLRDFAMMLWALAPSDESRASQVLTRLQAIGDSLVRFGAWRQVLEAITDMEECSGDVPLFDPLSLEDFAVALAGAADTYLTVAEILGEFDDPCIIDIARIGQAIGAGGAQRGFGARLIRFARLGNNATWLAVLAALPEDSSWAASAQWIDGHFLVELAQMVDVVARRTGATQTLAALARRIRNWSRADVFSTELDSGDGWGWAQLIQMVAAHAPSDTTARWLIDVAPKSWRARHAVLDALPVLVAQAGHAGIDVSPDLVVDAYCAGAGLILEEGGLVEAVEFQADSLAEYHRIERSLLGHQRDDGVRGLIDALPSAFLPVAFGTLVGDQRREDAEQRARLSDPAWQAVFEETGAGAPQADEEPQSLAELKARLQRRCASTMSDDQALGDLVDDIRLDDYWSGDRARQLVLEHLLSRVRDSLKGPGDYIKVYHEAARASRSAVARILLLDALVSSDDSADCAEIVDDLLCDGRVYHCLHATYFIWRAIRARWSALSSIARAKILDNIAAIQRSPRFDGVYAVGPLLDAVPEIDRPEALRPYLQLYELHGWSAAPTPPDRDGPRVFSGGMTADARYDRHLKLESVSEECERRWRCVLRWTADELARASGEQLAEAIGDHLAVIDGFLLEPGVLERTPWPIQAWRTFLQQLEERRTDNGPADVALTGEHLHALAEWAFRIAASQAPGQVNVDHTPLDLQHTHISERALWCDAVELLDVVLAHPRLSGDGRLRARLFADEVARMVNDIAPNVARRLMAGIRPYHWFNDARGRQLLYGLLTRPGMDPGAMTWAFGIVRYFGRDEHRDLIRWWCEGNGAVPDGEPAHKFAGEVGQHLGRGTIRRDQAGEHLWPRPMVEGYVQRRPEGGLLAIDAAYHAWLVGVLRGARHSADHDELPPSAATDYAALVTACWRRLRELELPPKAQDAEADRIALFVFNGVLDAARGRSKDAAALERAPQWWRALASLACETIRDGSAGEVFWLVFRLREPASVACLGVDALRGVVDAFIDRIEREGAAVEVAGRWPDSLTYAAELLKHVALAATPSDLLVGRIYAALDAWPAAVRGVLEAKRVVRDHGGSH